MQPVYSEFVEFLDSHGCDTSWYQESTFWLDNNIIKAFIVGGGKSFVYLGLLLMII